MILSWFSFGVSFLGILIGILLARIALEEMFQGRKYFIWLRRILFSLAVFIVGYGFWIGKIRVLLIVLLVLSLIWWYVDLKKISLYTHLFPYLLLGAAYFKLDLQMQLLLASLLFLYGFPTGTLLRTTWSGQIRS